MSSSWVVSPCRAVSLRELGGLVPGSHVSMMAGGVVQNVHPLREREFASGVVLNFDVTDAKGDTARLFFFDEWARAVSFAGVGDEVVIRNFSLKDAPAGAAFSTYITAQADSEVVVAQEADQNDVVEMLVTPRDFDNPIARVRRAGIGASPKKTFSLANDVVGGRVVHE